MPKADGTLTQEEQRIAKAEAAAKEHVRGYKPKTGKIFDGARSFVETQMDLTFDIQERWSGLLEERKANREQLRSLYTQGLLTREEAVDMFTEYPARSKSDDGVDPASEPASEPEPAVAA